MQNSTVLAAVAAVAVLVGLVSFACMIPLVRESFGAAVRRAWSPRGLLFALFAIPFVLVGGSKHGNAIRIESVVSTAKDVTITWQADQVLEGCVYRVQAMKAGVVGAQWYDLGETSGTQFVHRGFMVGDTYHYRVIAEKE